jgi:hypothetical protein
MRFSGAIVLLVSGGASAVSPALAQSPLDDSVNAAAQVLREIMAVPSSTFPNPCCTRRKESRSFREW